MDSLYVKKEFITAKQLPAYLQEPAAFTPLNKIHNKAFKRCFDVTGSVFLIVTVLSWLTPLIAILIKLDSRGPVFFRQKRNRKDGGVFTCLKFRTMIVNDEADFLAARENDHRITQFGKFLRRNHLDELPQLINVLIGQMSLIGPRPYMIQENIYYENLLQTYSQRHAIKPGITGLAQSYGYFGSYHELQKVKERVRLDILYVRKWSPGMDIMILYRTFMMAIGARSRETGN